VAPRAADDPRGRSRSSPLMPAFRKRLAREILADFLLLAYHTTDKPPEDGGRSLFAFKLHQFISGGGKVFTTLEAPGKRFLTLDGSQYVPGDRGRKLYSVHFCRDCGQEYLPVWDENTPVGRQFSPRNIEDRSHEDEEVRNGFFMPDTSAIWEDTLDRYPESWLERSGDNYRLKSTYRRGSRSTSGSTARVRWTMEASLVGTSLAASAFA
jgi:hypothetical protein